MYFVKGSSHYIVMCTYLVDLHEIIDMFKVNHIIQLIDIIDLLLSVIDDR